MLKFDRTNGIEAVLKTLTAQEEQVVRLRFAIGVDRKHTLKELSQRHSLTGEQLQEIESTALRKLRRAVREKLQPEAYVQRKSSLSQDRKIFLPESR